MFDVESTAVILRLSHRKTPKFSQPVANRIVILKYMTGLGIKRS